MFDELRYWDSSNFVEAVSFGDWVRIFWGDPSDYFLEKLSDADSLFEGGISEEGTYMNYLPLGASFKLFITVISIWFKGS